MADKENQIKELAKEIRDAVFKSNQGIVTDRIADHLYEAGYRKQSEGEWEQQLRPYEKVNISLKGTTDWNTRCHCPICHKDLFDGQKYCSNCGQLLDWGNRPTEGDQ